MWDSEPVSTRDNRVLNGPLGRSLRSLPRGTVVIHESVFTLKKRFMRTIEILVVSRNTPNVKLWIPSLPESCKNPQTRVDVVVVDFITALLVLGECRDDGIYVYI